jgi:hypothetical protein
MSENRSKKPEKEEKNQKKTDDALEEKKKKENKEAGKKEEKPKAESKPEKSSSEVAKEDQEEGGRGAMFYMLLILGGMIGICLLLFVLAIVIGIASGDSEEAAAFVAIVRDLFIVLLAMQGMVICIALVVMILQLSTLLNVMENEIKPMIDNMHQTTSTIRGTAEFLSKNVTKPVIQTRSYITGAMALFREISGIRQAMQGKPKSDSDKSGKDDASNDETA